MTPNAPQIRAQIEAVLREVPHAGIVGIRSEQRGDWPAQISIGARRFDLRWCDSPLAVRIALHEAKQHANGGLALLTPLPDAQLGADVLARLARGRLFNIQQWEIVRNTFRAREIDARLVTHGWMPELLIESMPSDGYPPAPSGVLDTDTAWRWTLLAACGLDAARPDPETLLRWTLAGDGPQRLQALAERPRAGITAWLSASAGDVGQLIVAAIGTGFGRDAMPLGLVLDLLMRDEATGLSDIAAAAVRFERFTGGRRVDPLLGRRWADAAIRVLRGLEASHAKHVLERADTLAAELYLQPHVGLSNFLPSGFELRLAQFAAALNDFAARAGEQRLAGVEAALRRIKSHEMAATVVARVERAEMATRLSRWLATPPTVSAEFESLVTDYVSAGAYTDSARTRLVGGDQSAELSRALSGLAVHVAARREQINSLFADSLKNWNETGSSASSLLGVEQILTRVIAPLAQHAPVLLLVVDGLSIAVLTELEQDISRLGWVSMQPEEEPWLGAAVAMLPTVTEVSRASLLSGRLTTGAQAQERAAFTAYESFAPHVRNGAPLLFHKGDLLGSDGLAAAVREAVGNRDRKIIGVVYNAIDDQLDGADQLHLRWTLEDLRLLPALLHEARGAGRVVVLTADHGHVLELGTEKRTGSGADRWRAPDGALGEGEIGIEGGRVLTPSGATAVVVPFSERIRYGAKKNGYHGGASPQEVLVPLRVLAPTGVTLPGWQLALEQRPVWWTGADSPALETVTATTLRPAIQATSPSKDARQASLFETAAATVPQAAPIRGDLIASLLSSSVYQTQKALAARVAPDDAMLRELLVALRERGGKLPVGAAAQRLRLPVGRLNGFLAAARRVLNVDRSAVLMVDETSGTIELNEALLAVQFQLPTT